MTGDRVHRASFRADGGAIGWVIGSSGSGIGVGVKAESPTAGSAFDNSQEAVTVLFVEEGV